MKIFIELFMQVLRFLFQSFSRFRLALHGMWKIALRISLRIIRKRRLLWFKITLPFKLYMIGSHLIFFWLLLQWTTPETILNLYLVFIPATFFGLGFLCQIYSYRKHLHSTAIRFFALIMHAFVAVIAVSLSREIVYNALLLPPQYFDLTVSIVALIAFVPLYGILLIFFLTITYIFLGLVAVSFSVLIFVIESMLASRNLQSRNARKLINIMSRLRRGFWFHCFGALVLTLWGSALLDQVLAFRDDIKEPIRSFAYYADFHPAGIYPGVPCNRRIRIQDNGVIAIGLKTDSGIKIQTTSFRERDSINGCVDRIK